MGIKLASLFSTPFLQGMLCSVKHLRRYARSSPQNAPQVSVCRFLLYDVTPQLNMPITFSVTPQHKISYNSFGAYRIVTFGQTDVRRLQVQLLYRVWMRPPAELQRKNVRHFSRSHRQGRKHSANDSFATAPHMRFKALQKVYEMWVKISVRGWRMLVKRLESIYTCCGWCTSESTTTNNNYNYNSPIDTKYKYVLAWSHLIHKNF
jgi:hypothetical protein